VAAAQGAVVAAVVVAEVAVVVDSVGRLGVGLAWRRELELSVARVPGIEFVEVLAESVNPRRLPPSLRALRARAVPVVPHGVGLSLGGADRPDPGRLKHLARLARELDAPLVSEHLAFVRGGGFEAGHLLPVARTRPALDVVCANIEETQAALPVPLAIENVAALLDWPEPEMSETEFLARIAERTGVLLLVDVANLHANALNFGGDACEALEALPMDRIAYVHVAGGVDRAGFYHDTHAHQVPPAVFGLLNHLCSCGAPAGVLLEYDRRFPTDAHLVSELDAIRAAMQLAHV
jgi:uncharacterized protein (UPF0276 family)